MATPGQPADGAPNDGPRRVKWTRKSVPKTRTGCMTCKTRHLKCDEEKPVCRRCIASGLRCLGYVANDGSARAGPRGKAGRAAAAAAPSSSALTTKAQKQRQGLDQLVCFLPINMDIPGPPMERELFHHVRQTTIRDLAGGAGPAVFWYNHALPLSHTVKPVKHALCAFAAAHRAFLSRGYHQDDQAPGPGGPSHHELAIQHYNRAISQIQPLMSSPTPANIDTILVCCVIFTTLENMVGRHTESLRHLRAGWQLLESYQPAEPAPDAHAHVPAHAAGSAQLFHDVAGMLSRLHLDTSIYVMDDLVPTHGSFLRPLLDMGDPSVPFGSAAEAEDALHDFDVVYSSFLDSMCASWGAASCDGPPPDPRPMAELEPTTPFTGLDASWDRMAAVFDRWAARFTLYLGEVRRRSPAATADELYRSRVLTLHAAVWRSLIKLRSLEDDIDMDDCLEILSIAESLAPQCAQGTPARPVFTFAAELIPPLALVGMSCGDNVDVQRRTTRLLRSLHRRESVWDSRDVAEILEGMYLARDQGLMTRDTMPWGLSELAKMLAAFRVPSLSMTNGALGMVVRTPDTGTG